MNITVIGTGYVGLVTGACFSEMGNIVCCVDVDQAKINNLLNGILPIYEPGLESLVIENVRQNRLRFSTSISEVAAETDIFFIAVGTPPGEDGSADMQYVMKVAEDLGRFITRDAVIVDKSTVPVGTADRVKAAIQAQLDIRGVDIWFDVVSNPEFLKEGAAIKDFMSPDRIVIGTESPKTKELMDELYAPFTRNHPRTVYMGVRDAEMTKYAANAMLATKISFMNEIANLCERLGVDVENVRLGIGSDARIGFHFIYPGAGYGGSCFPKDVKALVHMANECDFDPVLLSAVEDRNNSQKNVLYQKLERLCPEGLVGKRVGIWGLAFKPGTDDMRAAPSVVLINSLVAAGAIVHAYDPVAIAAARKEFSAADIKDGKINFSDNQYDAVTDADALFVVTEWKPFRHPDLEKLKALMRQPLILDGRNIYDPALFASSGFEYHGIGRELLL